MADSKQKRELLILLVLVVAAGLLWHFYAGGSKGAGRSSISASGNYTPIDAQDFGSVFEDLKGAQSAEYKSTGRNIFVATAVPVVQGAAPVKVKPPHPNQGPQLPPPPPPAQLAMKFFGYGNLPSGGPRQAFLLDGDDVHIVSEGDTLLNHIRILRIGNDRIEFEDTTTGQRGSNALEVAPQA